jgi:hypothetical protein
MVTFSVPERYRAAGISCREMAQMLHPYTGDFFSDFAPFLALCWRSQ